MNAINCNKIIVFNCFKQLIPNKACINARLVSTLPHITTQPKGKPQKIFEHFQQSNTLNLLNEFPKEVKRVMTNKLPDGIYIANEDAAEEIFNILRSRRKPGVPFIEINPGPGLLTKRMLKVEPSKIKLCESNPYFEPILQEMIEQYPNNSELYIHNFLKIVTNLWRQKTHFFEDLTECGWHEEINCQLFGCISSKRLISDLAKSIFRQTGFFANGRKELFLLLPADVLMEMICNKSAGYKFYNSRSCIFQIIFEYELLARIPTTNFLPWFRNKRYSKIEEDYLYFLRMEPRKDLLEICHRNDLHALGQFVYQLFHSRRAYLIQQLEKWVPGCGLQIISSSQQMDLNTKNRIRSDLISEYIEPCVELDNKQFLNCIHVFTRCGELKPFEVLSIFNRLKATPNFEKIFINQSQMSNNLEE